MYGRQVWKLNVSLLKDVKIGNEYVCLFDKLKRRRGDFGIVVK